MVNPAVLAYLHVERELLAHRAARWFQGLPDEEDTGEFAMLERMDEQWREMTPEIRAELERIREASAVAWSWPAAAEPGAPPCDVAAHESVGLPPRRRAGVS